MKAFKEFLAEGKRTYKYRIKVANCKLDNDRLSQLEHCLQAFKLVDISKPKSLPITKTIEFAKLGPVERQVIDVELDYPTTSENIRGYAQWALKCPAENILVTTTLEDEMIMNPLSNTEDGSILDNPELPTVDGAQESVGLKRVENLLKELGKVKHGENDGPKEKDAKTTNDAAQGNTSPVGTNKNKLQPSRTGSKI